jgi:hypothetical protein
MPYFEDWLPGSVLASFQSTSIFSPVEFCFAS